MINLLTITDAELLIYVYYTYNNDNTYYHYYRYIQQTVHQVELGKLTLQNGQNLR